ncbi:MAG: hypothetical protein ACSHW0_09610 [Thalassotalea sp.]
MITYTENQVVLRLNQYNKELYLKKRFTLHSNVHGQISTGTFGHNYQASFDPFKKRSEVENDKLNLKLPLPKFAIPHSKDVCFYVKDDTGNILPAKATNRVLSNDHGFTNPRWQNTYALQGRVPGIKSALIQQENALIKLKDDYQQAVKYVATSPIITNNQCHMPAHSYPEPKTPFSNNYLKLKPLMPTAICMLSNINEISINAKLRLIDNININFHGLTDDDLDMSFNHYMNDLDKGRAPLAFSNLAVNAFDKVFRQPLRCTSNKCRIQNELLAGSPYRFYKKAFAHCTATVSSAINNKLNEFKLAHQRWLNEPQERLNQCQTMLKLNNTGPQQVSRLENIKGWLNRDLEKYSKQKPIAEGSIYGYGKAFETPCSI